MAFEQAAANSPRPQSEAERLNNRLAEIVGQLYMLRNRINTVADHIVGMSPVPPEPSSQLNGKIEPVSSNTQHFIVDLEKAFTSCSTAISRLDNQGS